MSYLEFQTEHDCCARTSCDDLEAGCVTPQPANDHDHDHDHAHGSHHHHGGSTRAMIVALVLTMTLMIVEFVGSFITGSLALLADAGHMLTDVAALALSLGAVWLTRRPANAQRTFGFHRAEILAALLNGLSLAGLSLYVIYEAIARLSAPPEVASGLLLVIASAGLLTNLVAAAVLVRSRNENLNARSAYLHVVGDALGSVGAIVAAGLMYLFGWYLADPLVSLGISLLLIWSAWRLVKDTVDVLLEAAPASIDVVAVQQALQTSRGVENVHDLHVWSVASNFVALSGHVRLKEMASDHQRILGELRHLLHSRFGIEHVTLQLEQPIRPEEPWRTEER